MNAFPLRISLPGGAQADHVAGTSDPPAYTIAGEPIALDVTIPPDLAAAGWYWHGCALRWPADDPLRGIAITTDMYPPPGYPSERGSCFDCARRFEAMRAERHAQIVAERVRKATKATRRRMRCRCAHGRAASSASTRRMRWAWRLRRVEWSAWSRWQHRPSPQWRAGRRTSAGRHRAGL